MTGDGELQEGQIWESLATAAQRRLGELTVHGRPQQDPVGHLRVAAVSDLGDLEEKFAAFGWARARVRRP